MNESSVLQDLFEPNEENFQDNAPAPDLPIYDMGDLGDLALLKAALDGENAVAVDEAEAGEMPLCDSHDSMPDSIVQIDSDTDISNSEMQVHVAPPTRIEVVIPELAAERRIEYSAVHSRVVERLVDVREYRNDYIEYDLEFTDGRTDTFDIHGLLKQINGEKVLRRWHESPIMTYTFNGNKRKHVPDEEWDSELNDAASDAKASEEEKDDESSALHIGRKLRSREESRRPNYAGASFDSQGEDEDGSIEANQPTRRLRKRKSTQLKLTNMALNSSNFGHDQDELALESRQSSEGFDTFMPIVSDLAAKKGRPARSAKRSRRIKKQSERIARLSRKVLDDSDIEFEPPRRSARATRNQASMQDDAFMDDDSFYVIEDKAAAAPKIISVREVFRPISPDSNFGSAHMQECHTCGGSKQRGQLLHCQGCSLTYHKNCIGYRSNREHMVTKVGEDDFVLQCRFCLNTHLKKDRSAPRHSACQRCKKNGRACAPFSQKRTARQEEKLREENGGVDPVIPVSPDLINNSDNVLFRCATCHRGWHQEHLLFSGDDSVGTDVKPERLKDYSPDWQCHDCSSAESKIHRLVAWRPSAQQKQTPVPAYEDVNEDEREYLVKWREASFAHCSWVSGAWVFGVTAGTMRSSFAKRAAEQDLLQSTSEEAIPDEFVTPDIIFDVKLHSAGSRSKSKEEDLANISHVESILVKFHGLGYDDVVWDSPPSEDKPRLYSAFVEAYRGYIEGKYFRNEPSSRIKERIRVYKNDPFKDVDTQPAGLKRGKLMGYQIEGLNWLLQNFHQSRSVVLADEMGLGKTVQVIGLVTSLIQDTPKCWPFLIVVPNATCPNWRREFKQWAPGVRVVAYYGGKESQDIAYQYELFPNGTSEMKAQAVIMSYDSAQDPRTVSLFKSANWAGLVVDEGQRLKNDQNLLYTALRSMKIPFRLLLTGTPLQNNKRELFNLLQFIDEKQNAEKLDEEYAVLDKDNLPKLHEKIRPYFLRRTKLGVLKFLPPMAQIILPVTMTVIQEKLSKSIMAKNPQLIRAVFANSKMNAKDRGSLNNILMQLRKCLCHPFMYSEAIEERHHDPTVLHRNLVEASAKLLLLEIMLPKLKEWGHRVLIFSQFLQQLDIIEDFLNGVGYGYRRLDGSISSLEKQRRIDAFNEPGSELFAFLLSTRAGGVGINLATADTVIIMDPDFNPHQDIQALSRAHRIGQKNKVLCFQLMTKDSVEERIMEIGRKKMALDHALIESMDDEELEGADLESILKHGAQALFDEGYEKTAIQYDSASVDKLLDRSQMEKTAANDDNSAESQFNFARVWANDKLGFEERIDTGENQAPEPIGSSVWDRILAEREEEARLEAEANKEVLGRGARRRMAVNYGAKGAEKFVAGDVGGGESSDSSDDFDATNAPEESDDDEMDPSTTAEREAEILSTQQGASTKSRGLAFATQPLMKVTQPSPAIPGVGVPLQMGPRKRGRPRKSLVDPNGNVINTNGVVPHARPPARPPPAMKQSIAPALAYKTGYGNASELTGDEARRLQTRQHYEQYIAYRGRAAPIQAQAQMQAHTEFEYVSRLTSEAQVRVALDYVAHAQGNASMKERHIAALFHRLQEVRIQGGTAQS
ncbi:PHD/FYVE-zinc-finger like domain-containing protein [Trichoderma austrokoningii]